MIFDDNPSISLHTDNIFLDSNPSWDLVGVLIGFKDMNLESGGIILYEYSKKEINYLYSSIYKELPDKFKTKEVIYFIRGKFLDTLKINISKNLLILILKQV